MNRVTISEDPNGGWRIKSSDTFRTQRDAVTAARRTLGAAGGGQLEVRARNGRLRVETIHSEPASGVVATNTRQSVRQVWASLNMAQRVAVSVGALALLSGAIKSGTEVAAFAVDSFAKVTARRGPSALVTPWIGAQVWQDGRQLPLFTGDSREWHEPLVVDLASAPFELRFPEAVETVQVCAATDPVLHEPIEETEEAMDPRVEGARGDINQQTDCLGWMRSGARAPFETHLFLSTDTNNSFTGEALRPIDGMTEVKVTTVRDYGDAGARALDTFHERLYLILFVDEDDDQHVDTDEFEFLVLDF